LDLKLRFAGLDRIQLRLHQVRGGIILIGSISVSRMVPVSRANLGPKTMTAIKRTADNTTENDDRERPFGWDWYRASVLTESDSLASVYWDQRPGIGFPRAESGASGIVAPSYTKTHPGDIGCNPVLRHHPRRPLD